MEEKKFTTPATMTPAEETKDSMATPLTAEQAVKATEYFTAKAKKAFKEAILKAGRNWFLMNQIVTVDNTGKAKARFFESKDTIGYAEGDTMLTPSVEISLRVSMRFDAFTAGTEQGKAIREKAFKLALKASHLDDVPADPNDEQHKTYFADCKTLVHDIYRLAGFGDYIKVKEKHVLTVLTHAKRIDKTANDFARVNEIMTALDAILYQTANKLTAVNLNDIAITVAEKVKKLKEEQKQAREQAKQDSKARIEAVKAEAIAEAKK